ncbi:hypothetical protein LOTGIDRAFT_182734 [Lottia gigantea]|uniref:Glycolipid transfer protein domain-containing protein n=1 Tax=Lottia gigantea TaxID=225164 RepID=V4BRE7_LOTGI|nr:hypothetical protein LOTGIDRAFT_182734 [Lottia gigantea]ESO91439.1 hypothetical protein LOTGIDRAFT_182734 [Lottia gigantea]
MAANNKTDFNLETLLTVFKNCRGEDNSLNIDRYNDAYEELCKLFYLLGKVFSFVASDVEEKIGILREYRKNDESNHYRTIDSMIQYEVDNKITNNKKKASGCRTLLRLHRALEFTYEFMIEINKADIKDKMSTAASESYGRSLAKFHPFLIRQAVYLAVHTLPRKELLMKNMNITDEESGKITLEQTIQEMKKVYDITQDIYTKNKLLDLP